ncbi:hypothetical protein P168DRAFT_304674 [Aspergillus campestris IBT 28561]|uniref:Uncharacterized protein n=1 Tax=Aspergillus campestris (strain IBT 28561) TaxID=1392248 RepID=A0A2I1D3F8_ASPC2|nr:uncharacterized protein P168DRAFT_304674 [Aspergillus campestris IBT 28561]PKY04388.1 hypothetical protein P168DRAFT_304674 [Aspergillus campestris IBT 28561]
MFKTLPIAVATALYFQAVHASEKPISFCTKGGCEEDSCPVALATAGTGYPNCVIYDSKDIFSEELGFPTAAHGAWKPFINVEEPNAGCTMMIKSPADTDMAGCGKLVGSFKHETCTNLAIHNTFMIQYCCGDVCGDALPGSRPSAKFRRALEGRGGGGGGVYLKYANGTIIPPSQEGIMKGSGPDSGKRSVLESVDLLPRGDKDKDEGKCKNWEPDSDMPNDPYTKPSDQSEFVYPSTTGGTTIQITHTRSQSWTHGSDMSISFADVVGFGTSISESFTEEESDSTTIEWTLPKGQDGKVAFTATLQCTRGTGKCDGKDFKGEICKPWKNGDGVLVGEYSVFVTN